MPSLPEIPTLDFALALVSALLVLAAAFYLARSRSSAAPGLPSLQRERKGEFGGDLFAEFVPDDTIRHLSVVGSLFLHVLLVASLPVLELLAPSPLLFNPRHYDLVILQYQIPEAPLTLPPDLMRANTESDPRKPEVPSKRDPLGLPEAEAEQTQRAEGPREGPVIQITAGPENPETPPLIEVLAESEMPADLAAAAHALPSIVVWNFEKQQAETLALIRPKRFELEGQPEALPGEEPALADLGLTLAPALNENPELPVSVGSVSPPGELWKALDTLGGPPTLGWGATNQDGQDGAGGAGGDPGISAAALQAALQQGLFGRLFGAEPGAAWGGSGEGPFRAGAEDGADGAGWGRGRLTPVPRKFHGIILVSNSLSSLPEATGVLSGNPIYTVYVEVPGSPRKWILQFCVPGPEAAPVEFAGEVVHVRRRKTINPPFAMRKEPLNLEFTPTIERLSQLPPRVVAYGVVDTQGNLHDARIVLGADPDTDGQVLANLRNWEFLPAFRDGEPVEVEALFGIPLY
jgi:hypothetical protein